MIKIGNKYILVNIDDIEWIEAERNYSRIHINGESFLIRKSLSFINKRLEKKNFLQVNRSVIINTEYIKELRSLKYSQYIVVLNNEKSWVWGPRFRNNLKKFFDRTRF